MTGIQKLKAFFDAYPGTVLWSLVSVLSMGIGVHKVQTGEMVLGLVFICCQIPWLLSAMAKYNVFMQGLPNEWPDLDKGI